MASRIGKILSRVLPKSGLGLSVGLLTTAGSLTLAKKLGARSEGEEIIGAAAVGTIAGGVIGSMWEKKNTDAIVHKFETYWPRNILILCGPPGCGKGTQAPKLVSLLDLPHLSSGDMLRAAVSNRTAVGLEAETYMNAGKFVPDEVVIGIIRDRIQESDCNSGFILDGFPRTLVQAEQLDQMLVGVGSSVTKILSFEVPHEVLEERICSRWIHKASGRSYNVRTAPPKSMKLDSDGNAIKETMLDDQTGQALYQRKDDTKEALKQRLIEHSKLTLPLVQHYQNRGIVKNINANQAITDVWSEIEMALHK